MRRHISLPARSFLWLLTLIAGALVPFIASAQTVIQKRVEYSSGTGFFVSHAGDIITNKHVVEGCKNGTIELRGAVTAKASPVAFHSRYDLALLRSEKAPPSVASLLADNRSISDGDPVMVIGYPLERARTAEHSVVMSRIVGMHGLLAQTEWLHFEDAAQQGNSGGPLLDDSGHVIGVITGKTELFKVDTRTNSRTSMGHSDVAVSLPHLIDFLKARRVLYNTMGSTAARHKSYVEQQASRFIVNIRCITSEQQF